MKLSDYIRIMGIDLRETEEVPTIDELRVVDNSDAGSLESMDEDASVMDVPLKLSEACVFAFDKHIDAIIGDEEGARSEHQKYTKLNIAQENSKEYDRRYKERPGNRIRFKR